MIEVEALLELLDLHSQGLGITGVAFKDLDRNRTTVGSAEQTVNDLQCALAAVATVAALGQWTAASLHVARRDIVEHEGAVGQVAFGQRRLDGRLASQQPVQCGVEFVLIDIAEIEDFTQAGGRRGRRESACCGEFGNGIEDTPGDEGDNEVAAASPS